MNTAVIALARPAAASSELVFGLRIFARETWAEFLRLLRAPSFCVPTIGFPLMFYVLFGMVLAPAHAHPAAAQHALANFMVLGCMASGLFALGITLAADRERGILELKRAMPVPHATYLAAKMVMAMAFAVIVTLLLMGLALAANATGLTLWRAALFLVLAVLGVIPFSAIGLLVGSLTRVSATPAILNLVYLPMSFLSGLWLPLSMLPPALVNLAPVWPTWQLLQLANGAAGEASAGTLVGHILALAACTAGCAFGAWRALARAR